LLTGELAGARVVLHGLAARPELNGSAGVAGRLSLGRYAVTLDGGIGPFDLKPENLRRL
jgi:hypothetical protein